MVSEGLVHGGRKGRVARAYDIMTNRKQSREVLEGAKARYSTHKYVLVTSSNRFYLPQFHPSPIVYLNIDLINQRNH